MDKEDGEEEEEPRDKKGVEAVRTMARWQFEVQWETSAQSVLQLQSAVSSCVQKVA